MGNTISDLYEDLGDGVPEKLSELVTQASLYAHYLVLDTDRVEKMNNEFDDLVESMSYDDLCTAYYYCSVKRPSFGGQKKYWRDMREAIHGRILERADGLSNSQVSDLIVHGMNFATRRKYKRNLIPPRNL